MPKNTGIYQHKEYIERLLEEDKKIAGKDTPYGRYLKALTELTTYTNEIYASGGELTKETHGKLLERYMNVAEMCVQYREKGDSKERRSVVDYIQKLISRDVKALNSVDKENPGKIQDIFEESRTIKVQITGQLKHRVGGEMSDRFPMIDKNGNKGFFTARTDTAKDEKWDELLDNVQKLLKVTDQQMEKFNKLRTDIKLRKTVGNKVRREPDEEKRLYHLAIGLGFCKNETQAKKFLNEQHTLLPALQYVASGMAKLTPGFNHQDRLGYDPYTRNDNKNVAMYDVAKLIGCEKLIAKAVPMVVVNGDKVIKGTFMEHANGSDINNLTADDPLRNFDAAVSPYNKDLYRDLADLQVLDYICGNIDRHKRNMIYKTEPEGVGKVKVTGVIAIDNDACFPEGEIENWEFEATVRRPARIYKPKNFRYVNEKTAQYILGLTRGKLDIVLRGNNISQKAIDLAWERTKEVQKVLGNMKKYEISFVSELNNITRMESKDKDPFDVGDLKKPSIFNNFNKIVGGTVSNSLEVKPFKANIPQAETISEEQMLLIDIEKIDHMSTRMGRINRLKTPTEEFVAMRDAMFELKRYSQELRSKIMKKETLTDKDFGKYREYLDALNDATKEYIKDKGISPKTAKGRERLQAAKSFETNTMELIHNLEMDMGLKKSGGNELDESIPIPENEFESF